MYSVFVSICSFFFLVGSGVREWGADEGKIYVDFPDLMSKRQSQCTENPCTFPTRQRNNTVYYAAENGSKTANTHVN
jgi:hypothetical protein